MLKHSYVTFFIITLCAISCKGHENEANPTYTVEKESVVLKYSLKEGFFTEYDSDGKPKYFKYPGKRITLIGKVIKNKEAGVSPSIAGDRSVVHFALLHNKTFPSSPKSRIVELWYDEHGLSCSHFKVGDKWKITLTEKGHLIDVQLYADEKTNENGKKVIKGERKGEEKVE